MDTARLYVGNYMFKKSTNNCIYIEKSDEINDSNGSISTNELFIRGKSFLTNEENNVSQPSYMKCKNINMPEFNILCDQQNNLIFN